VNPLDREARRRARADWPIRKFRLGEEPAEDVSSWTTPEERLRIAWSLSVEAWLVAGGSLPTYTRSELPATLVRDGRAPR
jgi:hypothetical protein